MLEGTFCPLLYARILLYIVVHSARGAENIGGASESP